MCSLQQTFMQQSGNLTYCLIGGAGRGYLGQAQAAAWALPDGDDLLGLTAHTPGQTLQPPATPVQDGWLDRAAADTANTQSPARSPNISVQASMLQWRASCTCIPCGFTACSPFHLSKSSCTQHSLQNGSGWQWHAWQGTFTCVILFLVCLLLCA